MYTVSNLLTKKLPLPQMWIETRWEYIHNRMQWYTKYMYEEPCISLVKHMVSWLQRSDCHLSVWKEIIKMSSSPMIQVERSFLAEFLELLIISALEYSWWKLGYNFPNCLLLEQIKDGIISYREPIVLQPIVFNF